MQEKKEKQQNFFDMGEKCIHAKQKLILTPTLIHYGKIVCADCGTWIKWGKKPDTKGGAIDGR